MEMDAPTTALADKLQAVLAGTQRQVVGQGAMLERLLMALLTGGHVLLEGLPGLAKTLAVKSLCEQVDARFKRIQFTPDLLPADILGTTIYNPKTTEFQVKQGPIFANLILADEINRAPAKVQSALLEAMQEQQVTLGDESFPLPQPFLVIATQNPLEQEGTYALPEAQVDRFLFHVEVHYPNAEEELAVMQRIVPRSLDPQRPSIASGSDARMQPEELLSARRALAHFHMDPAVERYMVQLVVGTRPGQGPERPWHRHIEVGASPRATLGLNLAARAHAFLQRRPYVTPDDVKAVAADVLRHRLALSYTAEDEGATASSVVASLLEGTPVP